MVLPFLIVLTLNAQQTAQTDRYRPLIHFSPARNWTNDPCGLYFADGRFHVVSHFAVPSLDAARVSADVLAGTLLGGAARAGA